MRQNAKGFNNTYFKLWSMSRGNFMDLGDLRKEYKKMQLRSSDLSADPIMQFGKWFEQAMDAGLVEPTAMQLATADREGRPSCRTVLLKGFGKEGFIFFTNYGSRKGNDLEVNPKACLLFYWNELERQVVIEGDVEKTSKELAEKYFHSRSRNSQISSAVSHQSHPLENREYMEEECGRFDMFFTEKEIPLPENWGGYIVKPHRIEFWQGRPSRMHDRFEYVKDGEQWQIQRLWP